MNIVLLSFVLLLAAASLGFQKSISAIVSFALMMLILGIYYLYLDERLLGLFQIFVYAGGVSVLMLFGLTFIGINTSLHKNRMWAAFGAFIVFILLVTFFWLHVNVLHVRVQTTKPINSLFSKSYSDFVIILALIGSSLLYATIKMVKVLTSKKNKNV